MNQLSYTTFYIIRHGETDWNKERRVQGITDIPLNETGIAQAKDLATELKNIHFDAAFSSDLMRAKQTTEIITLEKKLEVQTNTLLRERKFGKYEGLTRDALKTFDSLVANLSREEKYRFKEEDDIESDEEIVARLLTFLRETALLYPDKTILVGTHGGLIGAMLIHLGFFTYEERKRYAILNGAYLKIRTDGVDFFLDETKGIEKRS